MTDDDLAGGMKVRREVLGDEHVDRMLVRTTEFTKPFQEFISKNIWGDIWGRPGLDRRTRSAITLAVLTALRADHEIPMHVRAALKNGLTPAEISEVFLHTAAYAGAPAANRAFEVALEAIEAFEADGPDVPDGPAPAP